MCWHIFQKILSTILSVPDGTLERVVDGAFFLGCYDGAFCDNFNTKIKNITTFSITLFSKFLIQKLAIYPSPSKWILAHFQFNGKESVTRLSFIMKEQMSNWTEVSCGKTHHLPFKALGNGKLLYLITGHSAWNWRCHPFLCYRCQKGDSAKISH